MNILLRSDDVPGLEEVLRRARRLFEDNGYRGRRQVVARSIYPCSTR